MGRIWATELAEKRPMPISCVFYFGVENVLYARPRFEVTRPVFGMLRRELGVFTRCCGVMVLSPPVGSWVRSPRIPGATRCVRDPLGALATHWLGALAQATLACSLILIDVILCALRPLYSHRSSRVRRSTDA